VLHAALRIVVEEFRIAADARDGLDQLDLRVAGPAEGEVQAQRRGLAEIGLVLQLGFSLNRNSGTPSLSLKKAMALWMSGTTKPI
jgi:hypothetical protein